MAPEIFDEKEYGMPVDIWSMGVILYQLHTLELPFKSTTMSQVIRQVLSVNYDKDKIRGEPFLSIIGGCLKKDPNRRPSIN